MKSVLLGVVLMLFAAGNAFCVPGPTMQADSSETAFVNVCAIPNAR